MASFPHPYHPSHHHHCQNPVPSAPITTNTTTTCCCCHYNNHPSPPPQQQLSIDPLLLQSLVSLLQQQQLQQRPNLFSPYSNNKPQTHKNHNQRLHFQPQKKHNFQHLSEEQDQETNHFTLCSLLQRINTLESSLQHFSTSNKSCHHSYSLREAAARVIQTHFRTFLVRRSRTLSQLQDLAFIKSSFIAVKSSVLNKTHLNHGVVSHKVMDLLLKLDSIQGGDPMIRDGKRSISRDIVRFLDYIDELAGKRHGSSFYKPVKNMRFVRNISKSRALNSNIGYEDLSRNQKEIVEKLSDRIEKIRGFSRVCENDEKDVELEGFEQFIDDDDDGDDEDEDIVKVSKSRNGILVKSNGGKPRVKKSVSFDEDGNVYKIFHESVSNEDGSFTDGSDSWDDHGDALSKSTEYNEVVLEPEHPTSSQSKGSERDPIRNLRSDEYYEINKYCQDEDGNLVFSAPMPVKMESRADLMKKRKAVKIVK